MIYSNKNVLMIKDDISSFIGSKVMLSVGRGKQKPTITEGIINNAYPRIFTVSVPEGMDKKRTVSYSYTDVLTKAVEITVLDIAADF